MEINQQTQQITENGKWLNRNVIGFGLTSLLSDFCHEMATAVLPQFIQAIGSSAAVLGFIEGTAEATSSFIKLWAGYHSDKIGHRKEWSVIGYALTAISMAVIAFAFAWPIILIARAIGWLGRGIRGLLRDAMLADSVAPKDRGKAFGFHRAGDTAGAVIGPLAAFGILTYLSSHIEIVQLITSWLPDKAFELGGIFRVIFLLTLIPGILSVLSMVFLITDYGMLGMANGIGDFASSLIVGALWSRISPFWGFIYAIIVGTAGTVMMASLKSNNKTIS
jgi:MFS family permease